MAVRAVVFSAPINGRYSLDEVPKALQATEHQESIKALTLCNEL